MSPVRRLNRVFRLSKLITEPGGIRVTDAVAAATQNLESVRQTCLDKVDRCLNEIEALHAEAGRKASPEVRDEIYRLANQIHGLAGVFGLAPLGEAAFSLCELIDRLQHAGAWRWDAVEVHLNALRLLRRPEHVDDCDAVLEGLRRVADRAA